jgi:divalent metal cation (Fe/Co/Zn/Cd) transporter
VASPDREGAGVSNAAHDEDLRLSRIAMGLVAATLAYNVLEAVVALWWGARAQSSALVAFGFDSTIECAAALILLWRLGGHAEGGEAREERARRWVGITFLLLALYVVIDASWTLIAREAPEESLVGLVLAALSLLLMPALAIAKLRVAARLGSRALRAEALETIACAYLSLALLLGLAAHAVFGWWWADPAAALLMVPWLVKEGREGIGGGCCHD